MRQDQYERLQRLEEQLIDAFLIEADPTGWSGHGIALAAMDKQTRGDRVWCKRNAISGGALVVKVGDLLGRAQGFGGPMAPAKVDEDAEGDHIEAEIISAEREGAKLMARLKHGKP